MVSHNGTVGHVVRKIQAFDYPWSEDSLLVMHSDGLATHWDLARYPGLSRRPPGLIAGLLYRDHKRGRDDATVVVARRGERAAVTHIPLLSLEVRLEPDIVLARQRARQIAGLLGFTHLDQTRIATATSEIARNAFQYAGGGRVEFLVESGPKPALVIRVRERGPGIQDLQAILDGQYVSSTGMGLGIAGAKRLMDRFSIESGPGGGCNRLDGQGSPAPDRCARASRDRPDLGRPGEARTAGPAGGAPAAEPGVAQHPPGAARSPGRDRPDAQPRARRDQPRGRGPLCRAGRQCQGPQAPLGSEVPLPLRDEPRVPIAAEFDPQPDRLPPRPQRRRPDRRAGEAGPAHPQGGRGPLDPGRRPARPGEGRGGQGRDPGDQVRGRGGLRGPPGDDPPDRRPVVPSGWSSRTRRACRPCRPTRGSSPRSCGISSPTR